ncbi:hypothetical protein N9C93_00350 [Pelagibacterales bacterium]|nr:hypothetical protein [Pelagibacterales bacterium]
MIKKYCLVGLGKHSFNQVIPAILNTGNELICTVSRNNFFKEVKNYTSLTDALLSVDESTIFYLATPYTLHHIQAKEIACNGHSLFIEKPAFISLNDLNNFYSKIYNDNFFVECFMYKYSKMYNEFFKIWMLKKNDIDKIDINFTIPSFPKKSFRDNLNLKHVLLHDIGCYAISLIVELDILNLKFSVNDKKIDNILLIKASNKFISINIKIGIGLEYKNNVILKLKDEKYLFDFFFNGRKIIKKIYYNENELLSFEDNSCFESMLLKSKSYWIDSQKIRLDNMIKVCNINKNLYSHLI